MNWTEIKNTYPNSFDHLAKWIASLHPDRTTNIDSLDAEGHHSDYHLRIISESKKGGKKKADKDKNIAHFKIRDLFDFFDEQEIDVTIGICGVDFGTLNTHKRFYRIFVSIDNRKMYPEKDLIGMKFETRREAEIYSFYKCFQYLERQLNLVNMVNR